MSRTAAYERFVQSMQIGYEEWHDGVPYDLEALDGVSAEERDELQALLVRRRDEDWRDVQALARLGSATALAALEESTRGPNRAVRLAAGEHLHALGKLEDLSPLIAEALENGALGDGLAEAERLAAEHPTDRVKEALLRGTLCSGDGRAVRFAGLLFYLYGRADEPFDWSQRPFFLRFLAEDRAERRAAFDELCGALGISAPAFPC